MTWLSSFSLRPALASPNRSLRALARRVRASLPLLAGATLLAACLDPSSVRGELNKGRFLYVCDSSTRECEGGYATTFPSRIAVDTRFNLSFDPFNGAYVGSLESASERLLASRQASQTGWRALVPGMVGILDLSSNGELVDYTFVRLENANAIQVYAPRRARDGFRTETEWEAVVGSVALSNGQSTELIVEPVATDGVGLAGEALLDVTCDPPGIVELVRPSKRPARFALQATSVGATTCALTALGFTERFIVRVDGRSPEPDGGTDVDAGMDAEAADAEVADAEGDAQ